MGDVDIQDKTSGLKESAGSWLLWTARSQMQRNHAFDSTQKTAASQKRCGSIIQD